MTRILGKPYDLDPLRSLSRDGQERITAVVAIPWHELPSHEAEAFEEDLCRRVTGSRYGLEDLAVKLVACLGDCVLLEVGGDVSLLLDNYHEMMAEEKDDGHNP
jgi:hypothetical protein